MKNNFSNKICSWNFDIRDDKNKVKNDYFQYEVNSEVTDLKFVSFEKLLFIEYVIMPNMKTLSYGS